MHLPLHGGLVNEGNPKIGLDEYLDDIEAFHDEMVGEGSRREIALSERVDKHVAAAAALLAQNEPFAQEVFQGAWRTREAMLGRANGYQTLGREGA